MIYLAYLIFAFTAVQLLVALSNWLIRSRIGQSGDDCCGTVSVLVPARNEESTIGDLLSDLLQQEYADIEIMVFNDQSTDRTEQIVQEAASRDRRITLINSAGLPTGWLGKNYGCHRLAQQAQGSYFLFLDADVRISGGGIRQAAAYMRKHRLGLLSLFPAQQMVSWGERCSVPVMNYILMTLLPLVLVMRSRFVSLAAANGQFMLFDASIYRRLAPHERFRSEKVEDIAIARYYKGLGIRVACAAAGTAVSCRMYRSFGDAVSGFSKNVVHFFGNSYFAAILFWMHITLGFIPIFVSFGTEMILIYLLTAFATRVIVSLASRQNVLHNILLALPQQMALGLFIYRAYMNASKKEYQWKGRNIS